MSGLPSPNSCPSPPPHFGEGENKVEPLESAGSFSFHCHPGVSCFTECCRELELALSPYDVARLQGALGQGSQEFLEEYAVIEFGADDLYPKVYLAMVDDGRASCPFVTPSGCRVYEDRPAACRTYPLGRGASLDPLGQVREQFVLIREPHCQGFAEERTQTAQAWQEEQGLGDYHRGNDLLLSLLLNSPQGGARRRLSDGEAALYLDTLYGLDRFRLLPGVLASPVVADDLPALITLAVTWLQEQWRSAP